MSQFSEDLDHDLRKLKREMADHAQAAGSYFDGLLTQADALKNKMQGAFDVVSDEAAARYSLFIEAFADRFTRRLQTL